jgi:hypothetical protein
MSYKEIVIYIFVGFKSAIVIILAEDVIEGEIWVKGVLNITLY